MYGQRSENTLEV